MDSITWLKDNVSKPANHDSSQRVSRSTGFSSAPLQELNTNTNTAHFEQPRAAQLSASATAHHIAVASPVFCTGTASTSPHRTIGFDPMSVDYFGKWFQQQHQRSALRVALLPVSFDNPCRCATSFDYFDSAGLGKWFNQQHQRSTLRVADNFFPSPVSFDNRCRCATALPSIAALS